MFLLSFISTFPTPTSHFPRRLEASEVSVIKRRLDEALAFSLVLRSVIKELTEGGNHSHIHTQAIVAHTLLDFEDAFLLHTSDKHKLGTRDAT